MSTEVKFVVVKEKDGDTLKELPIVVILRDKETVTVVVDTKKINQQSK